ncbi:hypothetical protein PR202_gb02027 [Eleusine coracana subsp. coracana]|uniref:Uncharacterized protein n=1 Tax=Eleusine coracana subsp. coracana TaxID=191504 RepID=A0AAV5DVN6_ELECO|nr:hypothetical protein PR202_gb02027 [Eleusine coracana subsp. coracana]
MTMVAELAFRCLQQNGEMRPPIREVLDALRSIQEEGFGKKVITPRSPDTVHAPWDSISTTPSVGKQREHERIGVLELVRCIQNGACIHDTRVSISMVILATSLAVGLGKVPSRRSIETVEAPRSRKTGRRSTELIGMAGSVVDRRWVK